MSIDGVLQQPVRFRSSENQAEDKKQASQPVVAGRDQTVTGDIIDIKAMKAILYLGIRGDMSLPMEEPHLVDTRV
jgi:hypothetical protein